MFRERLSAHIQIIRRRFITQMDIDSKHTAKATQEFIKAKERNILDAESPDRITVEHFTC